ncbi:MAG: leucine-rich repeat protein [Oscillospiraceae bacterium]|nr:leucine-rich repeat protein [Oscillospiraceae bacterium]
MDQKKQWRRAAAFAVSLTMCAGSFAPVFADEADTAQAADHAAVDTIRGTETDTQESEAPATDEVTDTAAEETAPETAPDTPAADAPDAAAPETASSEAEVSETGAPESAEAEADTSAEAETDAPAEEAPAEEVPAETETPAEETAEITADGSETVTDETEELTDEELVTETELFFAGSSFYVKTADNKNIAQYTILDDSAKTVQLSTWSDNGNVSTTAEVPSSVTNTADGITYKVVEIKSGAFSSKNKLTRVTLPNGITSIPNTCFNSCSALTSVNIPASVTSIGDGAFKGCSALTSVNIHDGIASIGKYAFQNCKSLTSVTIPDSISVIDEGTFNGCSSLSSVNIPATVTTIKKNAFKDCSSLTSFDYEILDDAIDGCFTPGDIAGYSVDKTALDGTTSLDLVVYDVDVDSRNGFVSIMGIFIIGHGTETLHIPSEYDGSKVTGINTDAFSKNSGLYGINHLLPESVKDVEIPYTVTVVGERAFKDCTSIESCTWYGEDLVSQDSLDGTAEIYPQAFYGCIRLKVAPIDTNIFKVGDSAFQNCYAITTCHFADKGGKNGELSENDGMYFPDSLTIIGKNAFDSCESIERIYFANQFTTIGDYAFQKNLSLTDIVFEDMTNLTDGLPRGCFKDCQALEMVNIPAAIPKIGDECFMGCLELATVKFGNNGSSDCTEIGNYTFKNCTSLTDVTLSDSLTKIGNEAFYYCISLPNITYPDTLEEMGNKAFWNNLTLANVRIPDTCLKIGNQAFQGCVSFTSFTFPEGTEQISAGVLAQCINLASVTIPDSVKKINSGSGSQSTVLNYNKKYNNFSIYRIDLTRGPQPTSMRPEAYDHTTGAFADTALTTVKLPDTMTEIGGAAFWDCQGLREINMPGDMTTLGNYAFFNCHELPSPKFNHADPKLRTIGIGAFLLCNNLTEVDIPKTVTTTGSLAYTGTNVKKATFRNNPASEDWYLGAFYINRDDTYNSSPAALYRVRAAIEETLEEIVFTDDVTNCNKNAFRNAKNIRRVTLGSGLTEISEGMFEGANTLEQIIIPDTVTKIGARAFSGCRNLRQAVVLSNVTEIGTGAFAGSGADVRSNTSGKYTGLTFYSTPNTAMHKYYQGISGTDTGYQFFRDVSGISVNLTKAEFAAGKVSLAWTSTGTTGMKFNIYRATTKGARGDKVNSSPVSGTSYVDTSAPQNKLFYYQVVPVEGEDTELVASNQRSVYTGYTVTVQIKTAFGGKTITFNCENKNAKIYYKFGSSNITTNDAFVTPGQTIFLDTPMANAVFYKANVSGSWGPVQKWGVNNVKIAQPIITRSGKASDNNFKIYTQTKNSYIVYTLDGSVPAIAEGTQKLTVTNGRIIWGTSAVISVPKGRTVKAIAIRNGLVTSDVMEYKNK